MHTYRICGLTLASNVPLPELIQTASPGVECRFDLMSAGELSPGKFAWFHRWTAEDDIGSEAEPWACFARCGDEYLLRFPSCGDFFLSGDTARIRCRPLPGIPKVTVRHLLLDQVIPLALSRREQVVLHASAVLTSYGVIAFAAKAGSGKSTLAASFAQRGSAVLSDDCLVLRFVQDSWIALSSYPGVRLWPSAARGLFRQEAGGFDVAHYTNKRRVTDTNGLPFWSGSAPLRALFFLGDDSSAILIERLTPVWAFMRLVEFAYNLDITDAPFLRTQLETAGELATRVPAYAIHYPRQFARLSAVQETILNHLKEYHGP